MNKPRGRIFFQKKAVSESRSVELVELPCQHFADKEKLAMLTKWILETGFYTIRCTLCTDSMLTWQTVRHLINLSEQEVTECETKLKANCQNHSVPLRKCPCCNRLVQRESVETVYVKCPECLGKRGKDCSFCWDCLREGTGPPGSLCCYNNCSSFTLLQSCSIIRSPRSSVHQCPMVRRCPNCQELLTHCGGDNNIICPSCRCSFCYRCLATNTVHDSSCTIQANPSAM
ncbi:uncharacterized protein [Heterodontus francisci]|uniref:uncharacterized protein n=1 Tax=Heterodontus francisci TaxID=7792 RepID=UPI00355AE134